MSLIKGNHAGLGGAGAPGGALGSFYSHTIDQSLRFNDDDSAYLSWTPSSTGSRQITTYSYWIKKNEGSHSLLDMGTGTTTRFFHGYTNDSLQWMYYPGSNYDQNVATAKFRDSSAWYHVLYRIDVTQSTNTDRIRIYVNGTQLTDFSNTGGYPAQNTDLEYLNVSGVEHRIGRSWHSNNNYYDGYLAEVHYVDGTSYGPDTFGETKDGVWVPKEVSGVSYGTNGFHLPFADSNYIGRDKSGSKTLVTSPSFSTFGGGDTNFTQANYDRAFDNSLTTSSCDRTGSGGIIEITPSSSVTPVSHTMINTNSAAYTAASRPNSVLLQGSNDGGSNWTTIDDLTNGSGADTATTSSFSNTTSYAKLRLNISQNHGGSNTRFGEYIVIASEDNGDGENIIFNNNLAASDVVLDSPTNNFATMNPIYHSSSQATLLEGNLKVDGAGFVNAAHGYGAVSTFAIPKDKKIYIEVECTDSAGDSWFAGFASQSGLESGPSSTTVGGASAITTYNRSVMLNGSETDYGSSAGLGGLGVAKLAAGDILGCMCDGATGKVWFSRNGTYFKSPSTNNSGTTGDPAGGNHEIGTITNGTTEDVFFVAGSNTSASSIFVNFGQDSVNVASANADGNGIGTFEYAPPTDYLALCSSNLTDPTIGPGQSSQADDYFNTVLYTGDGTTSHAITGVGFQPDWVSIKNRSNARSGINYDVIRGANSDLRWDSTAQEDTSATNQLLSFDADGFTVGDKNNINGNNETIVAWNWKAGGTPVSNSNGSITSSVSAAPNAGFSIVSYTGTGANATVGHGLTQKPEWLVTKSRDSSLNWSFLQINDMTTDKVMALQATNAQFSSAGSFIESDFTATTFGVGTETPTNKSGDDFICYCFHSVEGYSKVGSYEGNSSSTDGPFVYTGFRPSWIIGKNADASGRWWIYDNKRTTFNDDGVENGRRLQANANTAESTSDSSNKVLFFSNGFKVNTSNSEWNTGNTYIYLAFAEQPFKFANSR